MNSFLQAGRRLKASWTERGCVTASWTASGCVTAAPPPTRTAPSGEVTVEGLLDRARVRDGRAAADTNGAVGGGGDLQRLADERLVVGD
jgi:hypothetical protein